MSIFQVVTLSCVMISATVFINLLSYDFYLDLKAKKKRMEEKKNV